MKYYVTILTSLYNCEQYLELFFDNLLEIDQFDQFELLLLHNAPTEAELDIINRRIVEHDNIKHVIIPQREGLYATWNRGIKIASADIITNWNVDDRRYSDTLYRQYQLFENKNVDIVCGDVIIVSDINLSERKSSIPDIEKDPFCVFRQFVLGCFPMWRKELHRKVGYFDEQFRITGDLEFQLRAAYGGAIFVKTAFVLGTFSWNGLNLSSGGRLQDDESALVAYRYKLYHIMDVASLWFGRKLDRNNIVNFGEKHNIDSLISKERHSSKVLGVSKYKAIWNAPYFLIRFLKKNISLLINGSK